MKRLSVTFKSDSLADRWKRHGEREKRFCPALAAVYYKGARFVFKFGMAALKLPRFLGLFNRGYNP